MTDPDQNAPTSPPGYTAEELERDNPHNAWMHDTAPSDATFEAAVERASSQTSTKMCARCVTPNRCAVWGCAPGTFPAERRAGPVPHHLDGKDYVATAHAPLSAVLYTLTHQTAAVDTSVNRGPTAPDLLHFRRNLEQRLSPRLGVRATAIYVGREQVVLLRSLPDYVLHTQAVQKYLGVRVYMVTDENHLHVSYNE